MHLFSCYALTILNPTNLCSVQLPLPQTISAIFNSQHCIPAAKWSKVLEAFDCIAYIVFIYILACNLSLCSEWKYCLAETLLPFFLSASQKKNKWFLKGKNVIQHSISSDTTYLCSVYVCILKSNYELKGHSQMLILNIFRRWWLILPFCCKFSSQKRCTSKSPVVGNGQLSLTKQQIFPDSHHSVAFKILHCPH